MIPNRRFVELLGLKETIWSPPSEARIGGELLGANPATARAIAQICEPSPATPGLSLLNVIHGCVAGCVTPGMRQYGARYRILLRVRGVPIRHFGGRRRPKIFR